MTMELKISSNPRRHRHRRNVSMDRHKAEELSITSAPKVAPTKLQELQPTGANPISDVRNATEDLDLVFSEDVQEIRDEAQVKNDADGDGEEIESKDTTEVADKPSDSEPLSDAEQKDKCNESATENAAKMSTVNAAQDETSVFSGVSESATQTEELYLEAPATQTTGGCCNFAHFEEDEPSQCTDGTDTASQTGNLPVAKCDCFICKIKYMADYVSEREREAKEFWNENVNTVLKAVKADNAK